MTDPIPSLLLDFCAKHYLTSYFSWYESPTVANKYHLYSSGGWLAEAQNEKILVSAEFYKNIRSGHDYNEKFEGWYRNMNDKFLDFTFPITRQIYVDKHGNDDKYEQYIFFALMHHIPLLDILECSPLILDSYRTLKMPHANIVTTEFTPDDKTRVDAITRVLTICDDLDEAKEILALAPTSWIARGLQRNAD